MKGLGVIFIGGQARRLNGQNKAEILIGGQSCLLRSARRLSELDRLALSRPQTHAPAPEGFTVLPDWPHPPGTGGPAFAVLGSLDWAQKNGFDFMITTPVDTPFLPEDFVSRLQSQWRAQGRNARPIVAAAGERQHNLHALWPSACFSAVKQSIEDGERRIHRLHTRLNSQTAAWDDHNAFLNINTPEDLARAQHLADGQQTTDQ